jgi:CRISPR-associated protein Csm1
MPKYLVKCDISGIQNFIFDVPSDGAARQLKARSFYVISITEIAYKYLSKHLSYSEELIYKGGGNFFAYFETESEEKLKQVFYDFQKEFFQESIFPIFAYVKATDDFKQDMRR